jgi:hypothetical protein
LNPVATALAECITEHNITRRWIENVLSVRQKDLYISQPSTLSDLEDYAEKAHSSLLYMMLESMRVTDEQTEYMASHVGVSYGICTLLRGTLYHMTNVSIIKVYYIYNTWTHVYVTYCYACRVTSISQWTP